MIRLTITLVSTSLLLSGEHGKPGVSTPAAHKPLYCENGVCEPVDPTTLDCPSDRRCPATRIPPEWWYGEKIKVKI